MFKYISRKDSKQFTDGKQCHVITMVCATYHNYEVTTVVYHNIEVISISLNQHVFEPKDFDFVAAMLWYSNKEAMLNDLVALL